MIPEPGQIVRVRARQYLVEEITAPPQPAEQTRVRLSCLDDDAQGAPLEVLWESEVDAEVLGARSWDGVAKRGFDAPRVFSAYLHAQRWNCVTATNPKLFQAPYRAGIEVTPYQLEPLRKALLLPRVNLFIADDVGLGKTIEAGLILRELIMRQKVRRVVVAAPPSVVLQWRDELEARFGLTFVIFNRDYVLDRRKERGYGVNAWTTHTRFIISHALLRDEDYAAPLRSWLDDEPGGSLLILDEAHNAAPASSAKYAIDSKLTRTVRDLAHRFEHRLFLSATPHNGHSNSFAALLEILDPQRFCRGVPVKGSKELEPIMVRRLKSDLAKIVEGFTKRVVVQDDIVGLPETAPELRLAKLLDEYRTHREEQLEGASKTKLAASTLVVIALQKRLLSSIDAFASTLRVHRRTLEKAAKKEKEKPAKPAKQPVARAASGTLPLPILLNPPGADDDRADMAEADVQAEEDEQMSAATLEALAEDPADAASAGRARREGALLDEMTEIAEASRYLPDPRVKKLCAWIRENMCAGLPELGARRPALPPTWNRRRVLIFTEYAATKDYLEQRLREAVAFTDDADNRIRTFHGGIGDEAREEIKREFNKSPDESPLRILIATDAAREGVNFQNHCADLFHFDVPWNPSRMEQRNGRIDRKNQRSPEVHCHYFVLQQRPEDRVLRALVKKTKVIQEQLGSLGKVVEARLATMLDATGIKHRDADQVAQQVEREDIDPARRAAVEEELEPARERTDALVKQTDQLREMLATSQEYLNLDERHFRDALSCSLELLGAPPLTPVPADAKAKGPAMWRLPELDKRLGADPSWADTLDTLRRPRKPDQKLWDWRRAEPIRPVTFSDSGTMDDHCVHLHLEHRVAQRLLGRFLAQGFVHDDLSRACVMHTKDARPRVVLLGRMSLFGDRAARLHDEILVVTARWVEASAREAGLKPYGEKEEDKTLALLEEAFGDEKLHEVAESTKRRLASSVGRDVGELLPTLRARAESAAVKAEEKLRARGDKEAKDMTALLEIQAKRIDHELEKLPGEDQLSLAFAKDEVRQKEADKKHWLRRRVQIATEKVSEPRRIREGYAIKARRVEPFGVVYLWPTSG